MLLSGHLAAGVLAGVGAARLGGRRASVRSMLAPAALGGITPDLLDKTRMALGGSIYGRTLGHSALFLLGIVAVWALWRAWSARSTPGAPADVRRRSQAPSTLRTAFGFWVLGVATHSVADLADDALRGLTRGGLVASSWFALPWATPYTHVFRVREPWITSEWMARLDAVTGGTSPLEALVLLAAGVWVVVRVAGRARASGPKT